MCPLETLVDVDEDTNNNNNQCQPLTKITKQFRFNVYHLKNERAQRNDTCFWLEHRTPTENTLFILCPSINIAIEIS